VSASAQDLSLAGSGPVAGQRTSEWQRFVYVTRALVVMEFKLRYFGSVLGYLWTLFRPLLLFGVLYVVFTRVIRFGGDVPHYPVVLLAGIVLWSFFADATSSALPSLVGRESLLRRLSFPRVAVPVAASMTAAANLVLGLVVLLVLAVVDGVTPAAAWLYVLPIGVGLVVLAVAVSLILSVLFVRFRDVQPIWEVSLQLAFWASPIIYTIDFVPARFREYVLWNPFAAAIEELRHQLVGAGSPSVAEVMGSVYEVLIPVGIACAVCLLGCVVFARLSRRIAEDL
jgi:ABC-2 type transport system permease protein